MATDCHENGILCSEGLLKSMWNEIGRVVVSVHYMSLSRVLVIRMEFHVVKVCMSHARMSLGDKCVRVWSCWCWKGCL